MQKKVSAKNFNMTAIGGLLDRIRNKEKPNPKRRMTRAERDGDGVEFKPYFAAEAKARLSRAGGDNRAGVEKIPQAEQGKARDKAGEKLGVSEPSDD